MMAIHPSIDACSSRGASFAEFISVIIPLLMGYLIIILFSTRLVIQGMRRAGTPGILVPGSQETLSNDRGTSLGNKQTNEWRLQIALRIVIESRTQRSTETSGMARWHYCSGRGDPFALVSKCVFPHSLLSCWLLDSLWFTDFLALALFLEL